MSTLPQNIEYSTDSSLSRDDTNLILKAVQIKHAVLNQSFGDEMALVCAGAKEGCITKTMMDAFRFESRLYSQINNLGYNTENSIVARCLQIEENADVWPNLEKGQNLSSFNIMDMGKRISSLLRLAGADEKNCKGGKH